VASVLSAPLPGGPRELSEKIDNAKNSKIAKLKNCNSQKFKKRRSILQISFVLKELRFGATSGSRL